MSIVASNNNLEYASFEGFEDKTEGFVHEPGHLGGASSTDEEETDAERLERERLEAERLEAERLRLLEQQEEETDENMNTFMDAYSSDMGGDMDAGASGFTNYEGFEDNTEPLPEPEPKNNSMSMNNLLSLDLLLKSILFGLLFYLVAHPDVCNMMKKVFGKLKGEPLRLACMALFVVCYYVINLLI